MKILVIGAGSIGKRHMRNLAAVGIPAGDIATIDPREDRRQEASALGIGHAYPTLEAALAAGKFDAAVVGSPTSLHITQGVELARRGIHMLMEKPLARDLAGIDTLKGLVNQNKVAVVMAYIFRSTPLTAKLKEILDAGSIGKVLYARGEFSEYLPDWHPYEDYRSFYMAEKSQGGGSILDQSHIMDLVHYLLGGFTSVYAFNSRVSGLEIRADDIAEMVVTLKSGIVVSLHTDIFGRDHKKQLEIKGERGNLMWNHYTNEVRHYDAESKSTQVYAKFPTDFNVNYLSQTRHFLDCCRGAAKPLASLQDGIETMELILAAEKSHDTGRVEKVGS